MFLLVSGASGAGKSTARRLVAGELEPGVECVELHDVVAMPRAPTLAWRQRATEAVVCHALKLQEDGRHVLLAGDPVAAGEVLAAPSADRLDGIAVCLLDVARDTQAARLVRGGTIQRSSCTTSRSRTGCASTRPTHTIDSRCCRSTVGSRCARS
jgi:hypothetical protein